MHKELLSTFVVTILVALTLIGCGGGGSACPSTLTILSITEGDVSVMKAGTDDWIEAEVEMELEVGDTIKTGDNSGAEITFFEGSTMELEAGTEIEIVSLDATCDTDITTIIMMQTIGTTISRVTKLLDPASRYEVETADGVAGVRGSVMIVQVLFGDLNYEDGTTLVTNLEGDIWIIVNGDEIQIPEGQTCIIRPGQPPELIPMNNPPLAEDDTAITDEDNPVTVDAPGVLNNDSDPDVGDTLTVTAVDTIGTVGVVTAWDADGSFTYDPNGQFEYLQASDSTTDSFNYTVSDGNGGFDTAAVTITINGVNDSPVEENNPPVEENNPPVAVDDSDTTPEDTPVIIDVLNNDSDTDGDTLTVDSVTQGANGAVTNNGDDVTYTPDPGFSGTDSFTYTISDGNGGTDTATVTVTVTATVIELPAKINVQIDTGPTASIYIWDNTSGGWATDEDTGDPVDGTNHVTSDNIKVAGGHSYCVWVGAPNVTYDVKSCPSGWSISPLGGGGEKACGYATADTTHPVHFTATN